MSYLTGRDIDFRTQVIRMTRKLPYEFKPKNKEKREVPIPASLISTLKKLLSDPWVFLILRCDTGIEDRALGTLGITWVFHFGVRTRGKV